MKNLSSIHVDLINFHLEDELRISDSVELLTNEADNLLIKVQINANALAHALDMFETHISSHQKFIDENLDTWDPRSTIYSFLEQNKYQAISQYLNDYHEPLKFYYDHALIKHLDTLPYDINYRYASAGAVFNSVLYAHLTQLKYDKDHIDDFFEHLDWETISLWNFKPMIKDLRRNFEALGLWYQYLPDLIIPTIKDVVWSSLNKIQKVSISATINHDTFALYMNGRLIHKLLIQTLPSDLIYHVVQQFLKLSKNPQTPNQVLLQSPLYDTIVSQYEQFISDPSKYDIILSKDKTYLADVEQATIILKRVFGMDQTWVNQLLTWREEQFVKNTMYLVAKSHNNGDIYFCIEAKGNIVDSLTPIIIPEDYFSNKEIIMKILANFTKNQQVFIPKNNQIFGLDEDF
jgi:hypothetical protein